jgi:hypothetical protein
VPTTLLIEGSSFFPAGAVVEGTNPPELVSPADADVWTPSHTMATLATTVLAFLRSEGPWPTPRPKARNSSSSSGSAEATDVLGSGGGGGGGGGHRGGGSPPAPQTPPRAPPALNPEPLVGEALLLAAMREQLGECMFPCKQVANSRFEEMRLALSAPRYLCLTPALRCFVAEESRLRPSTATVVFRCVGPV